MIRWQASGRHAEILVGLVYGLGAIWMYSYLGADLQRLTADHRREVIWTMVISSWAASVDTGRTPLAKA